MGAGQRGGPITLLQNMRQGMFVLKVTDTPKGSPTLNVYVQTSPDSGSTWTDIGSFAQMTQVGARFLFWNSTSLLDGTTTEAQTPTDGTLTAGNVLQVPMGNQWRIAYQAVGPTPAWDFTVESFLRE